MLCRSRTIAVVVAFSALLGCSSHDPLLALEEGRVGAATERQTAPPACADFAVQAPQGRVFLDSAFSASVVSPMKGAAYEWEGEGLYIERAGNQATLRCAWAGQHTISVTATTPACSATQSAQVRCVPATCRGFSDVRVCPGVRTTEGPLAFPKTSVLVRVAKGAQCPSEIQSPRGAWLGGALIDAAYSDGDQRPRFCGYHWTAPPSAPPDTTVLPHPADWQWDIPRVAAHGRHTLMRTALAAHGQDNLGQVQWTGPDEVPVRVAVVDTAASLWRDPDNNPHGKAVGTLIQDTACAGSPTCNVHVQNFLGLPLLRDTETLPGQTIIRRDTAHGGGFGGSADLTRAIIAAVAAGPNTRTVLNLSIAYDTAELLPSLLPSEGDFANRVVLEALRYARCHGALLIAAAGNGRVPSEADQPPALPARWTGLRALSASACTARFGVARFADANAPLLYAVSAVDFGARPLLNTRGAGQSVLAALGFSAVRHDPNGGFTRTLSGSSMSAATVSGIAASLWSHAPDLTPDGVIRELYAESEPLSVTADFEPFRGLLTPRFFSDVRRITRCSAAGDALGAATCTALPAPVATVPDSVVPDLPADALEREAAPPTTPSPGISPWEFPWIRPQPEGEPGCSSCSVKLRRATLDLILRSSFSPLNSLRLLVARSGAGVARFSGGAAAAEGEESVAPIADFPPESVPFTVTLDPVALGTPTAAELAYQVTVDNVVIDTSESVLLEPDDEL